ncbi:hypothetical protein KJ951_00950, partial [Patescibacteria group bacterium]|nr:hypothetical protein [Patescibacteria group bacterium]
MTNNKDESSERQSKLDSWLKQTLQSGSQPAQQKIEHKKRFFQKPAPKPQTAPKPQASPQPQHAKHPQRGGRPFYRTNRGPQQGPRP